jgi:hypothetical protein
MKINGINHSYRINIMKLEIYWKWYKKKILNYKIYSNKLKIIKLQHKKWKKLIKLKLLKYYKKWKIKLK